MSDGPERLRLVAYASLATHGFCVALFGQQQGANTHYVARQAPSEKYTAGRILDFQPVDAENVKPLPAELSVEFANDDPWPDVFLWDGTPFVGTADQLWEQLSPFRTTMEQMAPISLLDLALNASSPLSDQIASISLNYVNARFENALVQSWRQGLLKSRIQIEAARNLFLRNAPSDVEFDLIDLGAGQLSIEPASDTEQNPEVLEALAKAIASLAGLAKSVGVTVELRSNALSAGELELAGDEIASTDTAPAPQQSFEYEVTIFTIGIRAKEIFRHIHVSGDSSEKPSYNFQVVDGDEAASQISIEGWKNRLVLILMDDAHTLDPRMVTALGHRISEMSAEGAIIVFVPALPANHPSNYFDATPQIAELLTGVSAILDTSIARSPFWWGDQKRSLDRRIADIIGIIVAAGNESQTRFLERTKQFDRPPVLAIAYPPTTPRTVEVRDHFLSESFWQPVSRSVLDDYTGGAFQLADRTVFFEFATDPTDFPKFAGELINGLSNQSRQGKGGDVVVLDNFHIPETLSSLKFRDHVCAIDIEGRSGPRRRILVTAEKPNLEIIRAADAGGYGIVRYTDRATLSRLLKEREHIVGSLPDEVEIGSYETLPSHRQLAARGIDQRDIVKITYDEYREWLDVVPGDDRSLIMDNTRVVRSAKNPFSRLMDDHIVRRDFLIDRNSVVQALTDILVRRNLDVQYRALKRGSDLHRCWSPPIAGWKRFGIVDGIFPIAVIDLQAGEAPMQDIFIVDGDDAVPVLFQSRPFALWAQATLPSASSWMARFSITNTFGGFPIPPPFQVTRYDKTISSLSFPDMPSRLKRLSEELAQHVARSIATGSGENWKRGHRLALDLPAIEEMNAFVLSVYGLAPDATDIDIMMRLMEMNAGMTRLN